MKRILKWVGIGLGGLVGLLVLSGAIVYGLSERRLTRRYDVQPAALAMSSDPATVERGRHIAVVRGCTDCHTPTLGGRIFIDVPVVARLFASNLTSGRGGVASSYTDRDWVRSIRDGVGPDGKPLLFMPAHEFNVLGDEDVAALVAYIKSRPPVDNPPVRNRVGPIGRVLFLKGDLPLVPAELIDHEAPRAATPPAGPTAAYGAYLAASCKGCHGDGLSGGPIPGAPPTMAVARNITPDAATGIGAWSEQDFYTAIRTGKRPDGTELKADMPWRAYREMSADELRALWLYLRSVPAKVEGSR
jgi:mono/diheme cytochrome c family protein